MFRPPSLVAMPILILVVLLASFPIAWSSSVHAQTGGLSLYLPLIVDQSPPPATTSYYMESVNPLFYNDLGCAAGRDVPGIIVLFFGQPWYDPVRAAYGINLFDSNQTFASITDIEAAAEAWTDGFYHCSPIDVKVTLALGVNNFGPRSQITQAHGAAWGQMVNAVGAYVLAKGYDNQVSVAGANDIELLYNKADVTKAWVSGYDSAASFEHPFYTVGACEGCPYTGKPSSVPANGWTYDDLWYVHYKTFSARSLPQIYAACCSASQWQKFAQWVYNTHPVEPYRDITFSGTMTQFGACQDRANDFPCAEGTQNRPEEGWVQLFAELNTDATTAQQRLAWSSDVRWNFISGGSVRFAPTVR